jgi:hypothetical protein
MDAGSRAAMRVLEGAGGSAEIPPAICAGPQHMTSSGVSVEVRCGSPARGAALLG